MKFSSRNAALACGVAAVALMGGTAARAQERNFDVPAGDAVRAIPEFARQAGIQIVAPADQLRGVQTPPIKGVLDVHEALATLLAGTGVVIASDDGQTIVLRNRTGTAAASRAQARFRCDSSAQLFGRHRWR
jgi:iron complex outermembrane recepter protein